MWELRPTVRVLRQFQKVQGAAEDGIGICEPPTRNLRIDDAAVVIGQVKRLGIAKAPLGIRTVLDDHRPTSNASDSVANALS